MSSVLLIIRELRSVFSVPASQMRLFIHLAVSFPRRSVMLVEMNSDRWKNGGENGSEERSLSSGSKSGISALTAGSSIPTLFLF